MRPTAIQARPNTERGMGAAASRLPPAAVAFEGTGAVGGRSAGAGPVVQGNSGGGGRPRPMALYGAGRTAAANPQLVGRGPPPPIPRRPAGHFQAQGAVQSKPQDYAPSLHNTDAAQGWGNGLPTIHSGQAGWSEQDMRRRVVSPESATGYARVARDFFASAVGEISLAAGSIVYVQRRESRWAHVLSDDNRQGRVLSSILVALPGYQVEDHAQTQGQWDGGMGSPAMGGYAPFYNAQAGGGMDNGLSEGNDAAVGFSAHVQNGRTAKKRKLGDVDDVWQGMDLIQPDHAGSSMQADDGSAYSDAGYGYGMIFDNNMMRPGSAFSMDSSATSMYYDAPWNG